MWLNVFAVCLVGVFVAVGALRGALVSGLALATLLLSYAAAVTLGPAFAPALAPRLGAGELAALAVAGSAAFLVSFGLLGGLSALIGRRAAPPEGARDRFLGGAFGAVRGAGIALGLVYLALWLDVARATGVAPWWPETGQPAAARLTSEIVESAVEASLGTERPAARVVARVAARPAAAVGELSGLVESAPFAALRDDRMFWTYVESGNVDAALARVSFLDLQRDAGVRARLAGLGLVPEAAAGDPRAFRESLEGVMREVAPRLRAVQADPALQELLEDPEVAGMIQGGDTLALLRHPAFRALVDRVISQPSQG